MELLRMWAFAILQWHQGHGGVSEAVSPDPGLVSLGRWHTGAAQQTPGCRQWGPAPNASPACNQTHVSDLLMGIQGIYHLFRALMQMLPTYLNPETTCQVPPAPPLPPDGDGGIGL